MSNDLSDQKPFSFDSIRRKTAGWVGKKLGARPRLKRWVRLTGASLWTTLILTALTMIADHHDLLDRLDAPLFHSLSERNAHGDDVLGMPVVAGISPELFVDGFDGRSPLDRDGIRTLVEAIGDHRPSVVAIDLDLSPDKPGYRDPSFAPGRLYEAICRRALGTDGSGSKGSCLADAAQAAETRSEDQCGIRFALIEPMCPDDVEVYRLRAEWRNWMARTMAPCVRFARAEIRTVSRQVVDFDPNAETLGVVARKLADGTGMGPQASIQIPEDKPHCKGFTRSEDDLSRHNSVLFQRYLRASRTPDGIDPFVILRPEASGVPTTIASGSSFRNNVVFLGAVFGTADLFDVPGAGEQVHGVVVHASTYHSINFPLRETALGAAAVDLLVGTLAGIVFSMLWIPYNRARLTIHSTDDDLERNSARARMAIAGFGAVAALAAVVAGLCFWSQALLSMGLWLNPAPMLVGLFFATLIASRELPKDPEFCIDKKLANLQCPSFGRALNVVGWMIVLGLIGGALWTLL